MNFPKFSFPKFEIPKIDLSHMPKIEIPKIDIQNIPKISIPKIDMDKIKFPKVDFSKIKIPNFIHHKKKDDPIMVPLTNSIDEKIHNQENLVNSPIRNQSQINKMSKKDDIKEDQIKSVMIQKTDHLGVQPNFEINNLSDNEKFKSNLNKENKLIEPNNLNNVDKNANLDLLELFENEENDIDKKNKNLEDHNIIKKEIVKGSEKEEKEEKKLLNENEDSKETKRRRIQEKIDEIEQMLNESYICPIGQTILEDPVVADDGQTYERKFIVEWMMKNPTSPLTNEPFKSKDLKPNYMIKSQIESWKSKLNELRDKLKKY